MRINKININTESHIVHHYVIINCVHFCLSFIHLHRISTNFELLTSVAFTSYILALSPYFLAFTMNSYCFPCLSSNFYLIFSSSLASFIYIISSALILNSFSALSSNRLMKADPVWSDALKENIRMGRGFSRSLLHFSHLKFPFSSFTFFLHSGHPM